MSRSRTVVCDFLATHLALLWKFLESFLCLVGISRYYELDDNIYPVFLADDDESGHADPTKVRIGEKKIKEGQVPLLKSTRGRVVSLAGGAVDGQENPVNADIVRIEDEVPAIIADKPKGTRKKMKIASGANNFVLPPKRLMEDHGTSGDASASTAEKSLAVLQDLLECSTLAFEVGVTVAAIVPFITSSVTLIPEHEIGGRTDSIFGPNLRTQHPAERFVISSDSSRHSSANDADDEVTSIVRSSVPPPPVLTAIVATTAIVGATSTLVRESGTGPVQRRIFRDSASPSTAGVDIVGPSQPASAEVSTDTFYISQEIDSETLQQTYVPKWNVINDSALYDPKVDLLKEKDTEIANLKAQLSLKDAEAAKAIRLNSQVAAIEGTKAARVNELNSLKGWNTTLKGQLSYDELSVKVAFIESEKDKLIDQVSMLETTCSGLRDQVAELDSDLMGMALHMDEKFYPQYLAALGGAIGHFVDKGMQDGLAAVIDHGKAGRGLVDVATYNPSAEANYIFVVTALRAVDFLVLAQLESQKDASMADIMGLLHLEGPTAEASETNRLQPSPEQLMLPIHRPKDQVVIRETSLSFSLDVVPTMATTTALSTTFIRTRSVLPISLADYEVLGAGPSTEVPSPPKIVFEKEELETTPEHTTAP
ncbi:hypothetical protein Tco_0002469 [Tanacetum coccineum]